MKEELLNIEAILSSIAAQSTADQPDLDAIKAGIEEAREHLLNLAEGLEDSQRN